MAKRPHPPQDNGGTKRFGIGLLQTARPFLPLYSTAFPLELRNKKCAKNRRIVRRVPFKLLWHNVEALAIFRLPELNSPRRWPKSAKTKPLTLRRHEGTMRKIIWCGTALLVLGAGAVFFAGRYAAENPDSLLGRCAQTAYHVGVRCNPLMYLNRPAAPDQVAAGKPIAGAGLPIPAPEIPEHEQQEPMAERPEIVESIVVEDVDREPAAPAGQTVEPARIQEDSDFGPPAAGDDDVDKLPVAMPYADEDEELGFETECARMTDFFKRLVDGKEPCSKNCPSCTQCLVQSIVDCVKGLLGLDGDSSEQAEAPPDPVEVAPGAGQPNNEEAQEIRPGPTSGAGFREDPYHHQYPGCPYPGACPYPYRRILPPVTPPVAPSKNTEQPAAHSHVSLNEARILQWQWTQLNSPETGIKNWVNSLDLMTQPGIDTMECRPTDVPDLDHDETF
jgi:hypothetical protein